LWTRWSYPVLLCAICAFAYPAAKARHPFDKYFAGLLLLAALFLILIFFSWKVWGSYIDVDAEGVKWQEEEHPRTVKWDEIEGLVRVGLTLGLHPKGSTNPRPLPFATWRLYSTLASRLNPLSPSDEKMLFPYGRWS